MKVVNVKFVGIDSWNRPVFKDVKKKSFYGALYPLFSYGEEEEVVLERISEKDLIYFGSSFGCEPNGGRNQAINILKQ